MHRLIGIALGALALGAALVVYQPPSHALFMDAPLKSVSSGGGSAIAFNNFADLGNNGGGGATLSTSYSGASLTHGLLVACFAGAQSGNNISSISYGGNALTLGTNGSTPAQIVGNGTFRTLTLYYLLNPPSGSNTFQVTVSSDYALVTVAEYSGVKQTSQPDSTNGVLAGSAASSQTITDTIVNANSWAMSCAESESAGTFSSGTNATYRGDGAAFNLPSQFDSNAALTTGSQNITVNFSTSAVLGTVVAAFQPG